MVACFVLSLAITAVPLTPSPSGRGLGWVQTGNIVYRLDRGHRLQILKHRYGGTTYALETRNPDGSTNQADW
jgi:hypothetical protein